MNGDLDVPARFLPRPESKLDSIDKDYGTYTDRFRNCIAYYHSFGRRLLAVKLNDGRVLIDPDYA